VLPDCTQLRVDVRPSRAGGRRGVRYETVAGDDEARDPQGLCADSQAMFGRIGEKHEEFNMFVTELQAHVSLEFHVDPSVGVELIRSAVSLFPDDNEIKTIPHYVRNNRCKAGVLKPGDAPAEAQITTIDGEARSLSDLLSKDKPVVLMGASHT